MNYWLMKSEPSTFSIDHLAQCKSQTTAWDGVRNYQARNMLRDQMQVNDLAFFYHSSCAQPGIVGMMTVVRSGYVDNSAFDVNDHHYDPKSTPEKPLWYRVDVKLKQKFAEVISLEQLRHNPALKNMLILRKGNRLSITPLTAAEWQAVLTMI